MKGNPSGGGNPGNSGGGKDGRNKNNDDPHAWKTKFKTAKITHDGKEWEWCKEHKREGMYNAIYMPAPHDHTKWKEKRDKIRKKIKKKKEAKASGPPSSSSSSNGMKLALNDNLVYSR
eukprot:8589489-Ditylum_brightwellii.AAC.1